MLDFATQILLENIIFLICSFIAAVVATLAGFGSSTLLIPIATMFMDIRTAIFIVACFHLFNNLIKTNVFWHKIDLRVFLQFGLPSIVFAGLGAKMIAFFPLEILEKFLAVFLVGFSIFSLCKPKFFIPPSWFASILGGGLSGFMSGLIGLGGAIRSMFLVSINMPREMYVGTAAIIALVVDITRIPTYLFGNLALDTYFYRLLPFLLVTAYLGVKVGKHFLTKISQLVFRRIVFVALILIGIKLLF